MIRLTKHSDYGIVLMATLAASDDRRYNAPDLAAQTRLPLPMVSKILKLLVRGGLLESQRGAKGGYRLKRPPIEITVADIIAALEGPIAITECAEETTDECSYESVCLVRDNWLRINRAVTEALERINLAEMAQPLTGGYGDCGDADDADDCGAADDSSSSSFRHLVHLGS